MEMILNYERIYHQIVSSAKERTETLEIVERHHIVPTSLGGSNDPLNIVAVSPREHFILHKLLIKMTFGLARRKMINAFCYMAFTRNNKCLSRPVSSRDYEYARKICKDGMYTKERNEKISKTRQAKIASGWKQERTEETKAKHRETLARKKTAGIGMSEQQKAAISKGLVGNKNGAGYRVPDSHKKKIAEANSKTFSIKDPAGNTFEVKNLSIWLKNFGTKTKRLNYEFKKGPLKGYIITPSV